MGNRVVFSNSVVEIPDQPSITAMGIVVNAPDEKHCQEKMLINFFFGLDKAAKEKLEDRVAKGEVVLPDELKEIARPDSAAVKNLVEWLKNEGFEVQNAPSTTSVYASATAAQIEKSLNVQMVRVTKGGKTWTAARNAPSLPAEVAKGVTAVLGTQPFLRLNKHAIKRIPSHGNRADSGDNSTIEIAVAPAEEPAANIANAPPYLVSEILKAYGADGLNLTGKDQTIAILIDTLPKQSDLMLFWAKNNVSGKASRVKGIKVKAGLLPAREGEETLDASWASGVAPEANVRIYACGSLAWVDLNIAIDRITQDLDTYPEMRQMSVSLGMGEVYLRQPNGVPIDEVTAQHEKFLLLAAKGVNIFVSSGDAGSNPSNTGHSSTGPLQAEYAASDPCVIAVGGTTLNLKPNGTVDNETGWPGSGGGASIYFPRPAWQSGPGVPTGRNRVVPDVAAAGDPETGAFLIFDGNVQQIGGTSWSAPVWAGLCALINQARMKTGKPRLPFLNPLIYPLIGTECFRDIKTGRNGAFTAAPGYDLVTGLGVPNVAALISLLR